VSRRCRDSVAGDNQRHCSDCVGLRYADPRISSFTSHSRIILCHTMLATQNETNSCHQFRRHMEHISPGSTDSCRVAEQLTCRADVPNSTLALTWREDRFCAFIATLSIFHFSTPTHEEEIDLRATQSVRRTRSLQCQRSLIVAGDGATPSRHLLNYPRLRCLLLLVGPQYTPVGNAQG